jgi:DNA repair exonuclease SbcCD ATPase subunit
MKTKTRNNLAVAGIGLLFVLGLLVVSYLYEPSVEITNPEQDAQMISLKAQVIRTEADLRELEKLAYEYEMAYRENYNGATAMYFKSLCEPILVKAGDRRDKIRAKEDELRAAQNEFNKRLNDLDAAWRMVLGSDEEVLEMIAQNEAAIATLNETIMELVKRKEDLAVEAWSGSGGSLDERCLKEIGVVEDKIVKCKAEIEQHNVSIEQIKLACRLQRGAEPEAL